MAAPNIDLIIYSLSVTAALTLAVERILEVFKHFIDWESKRVNESAIAELQKQQCRDAEQQVRILRDALQELDKDDGDIQRAIILVTDTENSAESKARVSQYSEEMPDDDDLQFEYNAAIKVMPLSLRDLTLLKLRAFLQLSAFALGLILAELFDLKLLALFFGEETVQPFIDILATGLIIGGGSQPVHVLIRFLTTRKVEVVAEKNLIETSSPQGEGKLGVDDTTRWIPIAYRGGVDKDKLEYRNARAGNPQKIIYHHTAMHHQNSFQAVVDEITKVKGWSTGYHCVIMASGEIRFFCRWDRVGNHAKNHNQESLGIAFHGNFHIRGQDRFSNFNGQFGNQVPTPQQLKSGAMVIVLWAYVYGIAIDFDNTVLPHFRVRSTACPGSNFPHDELQEQIAYYYSLWQAEDAQQEIEDFRALPYVYV